MQMHGHYLISFFITQDCLEKIIKKLSVKSKLIQYGPAWWLVDKEIPTETKKSFANYTEYMVKMMQMLISCQSVELTKSFIEKCMPFGSEEICARLADLVVKFGWSALKTSLKTNFFVMETDEDVCNSCFLILSLHKLNKTQLAIECFRDLILPAIEKPVQFENVKPSTSWYYIEANYDKNYMVYYKLAETVALFSTNRDENMLKYMECMQQKLEYPDFDKLVDKLIRNVAQFAPVKEIIFDSLEVLMRCQLKHLNHFSKLQMPVFDNYVIQVARLNVTDEAALNFMELLEIVDDSRLVRYFLANLLGDCSPMLAPKLADLLVKYDWKSLSKSLRNNLLKTTNEENIVNHCNLVKVRRVFFLIQYNHK